MIETPSLSEALLLPTQVSGKGPTPSPGVKKVQLHLWIQRMDEGLDFICC